jgi:hypothetical protein
VGGTHGAGVRERDEERSSGRTLVVGEGSGGGEEITAQPVWAMTMDREEPRLVSATTEASCVKLLHCDGKVLGG